MYETYTISDYISQYQACVKHNMYHMLDLMLDLPQTRHRSEYVSGLNMLKCVADSMTLIERTRPEILNPSHCRRIAQGSGTPWTLQGELLEEFFQARTWNEMMTEMSISEKIKMIDDRYGPNC